MVASEAYGPEHPSQLGEEDKHRSALNLVIDGLGSAEPCNLQGLDSKKEGEGGQAQISFKPGNSRGSDSPNHAIYEVRG